ncbi:hypothetical protein SAMN05216249_11234 [Acetitomaculum ruminis DSM 5522]|uniref:ABC-2 family transporter protein n=1 Tax=Acetitomaculum ruminis DSM 5522 TaxID=1120918 RepID=A0A1I0YZ71_9FIRM|nr:hypothetical protein [Acetitomaculum ruminis]SFB18739.1 hypothetical protein SAMN05216249_11234 [Acetitomaculum ruminis DSM 5522]
MGEMKKIKYEIKKLSLGKKALWVEIIVTAILVLGLFFQIYIDKSKGYTIYEGFLMWKSEGAFSKDVEFLYKKDYDTYKNDINNFPDYINQIINYKEKNTLTGIFKKETEFDKKNLENTAKEYKKIKDIKVKPSYMYGISTLFFGQWQNIPYLFLVPFFGLGAFSKDSWQTRAFLKTTLEGRRNLSFNQLQAAAFKVSRVYVTSGIICVFLLLFATDLPGLFNTVQSIPGFITSPLKLSVWEILIVRFIMKWLGLMVTLLLIYLLSGFFWSYLEVFIGLIIFFLFQYEVFNGINIHSDIAFFHFFNYYNLLCPEKLLCNYINVNICNHCVNGTDLLIFTMVIFGLISFLVGSYFHRNYIPQKNKKRLSHYIFNLRKLFVVRHHDLLYFEGKKLFIIAKGALVLLLFVMGLTYKSYQNRHFFDFNEYFYNYYADEVQKLEVGYERTFIEEEREKLYTKMEEAATDESIDDTLIDIQMDALDKISLEIDDVEMRRNENKNADFLNQTPWLKLFRIIPPERKVFLWVSVMTVLLVPVVFENIYEKKHKVLCDFFFLVGMKKRRISALKIRMLYGILVWLALLARDFYEIIGKYSIYGWGKNSSSLLFLTDMPVTMPIFLLYFLYQAGWLVIIAGIVNSSFLLIRK